MSLFENIRRNIRRRSILKSIEKIRNLTVGDMMTKYVITIKPDDDIIKAATKMIAEDISCLVVVENDKPLAVLSERDFMRKVPLSKEVFTMKVSDIMSDKLVTVPPTMRLPEAAALMKERNFRRLVVAENGRLLGVVTQTDFTRTLSKNFTSYPVIPELQVDHIMTTDVLSVTTKDTVADAKKKMLKQEVGAIIIAEKGVTYGIFTEYDLLMQFYDQRGKLVMKEISSYMRKYVRAMPADASIMEANRLMLEKNMRRLLIVDGTKTLGILTQTDICRYIYLNFDLIAKAAQNPAVQLKRFSLASEIHGEFKGDHLKVYTVD